MFESIFLNLDLDLLAVSARNIGGGCGGSRLNNPNILMMSKHSHFPSTWGGRDKLMSGECFKKFAKFLIVDVGF